MRSPQQRDHKALQRLHPVFQAFDVTGGSGFIAHRFGSFQLSIGRKPRVGGGDQIASADEGGAR